MKKPLNLEIRSRIDCLCDFTYNFYWQHKGSELDPDAPIKEQVNTNYTYRDLVEHLRSGCDVQITGNVGSRLASSLGVDLKYFGGNGQALDVGSIYIVGDVGTRMGISMMAGRIYVSGNVSEPMGNIVEVNSDTSGYRCFRSITDILHNGLNASELYDSRNSYQDGETPILDLADNILRDTIGARCVKNVFIKVKGDVSLSTGILMRKGIIEVDGNAGMNTATLLSGGTVVVRGSNSEFGAADMRSGNLIITGKTKGYMCANIRGGAVFVKADIKVIPPASKSQPSSRDLKMLIEILETNRLDAMSYRKYSV